MKDKLPHCLSKFVTYAIQLSGGICLIIVPRYSNRCMQKMIEVNKELIPLVDDEGNTALHLACIHGFTNVANELIEKGAAVDVRCVCMIVLISHMIY